MTLTAIDPNEMWTSSGRRVNPLDLKVDDVCLEDIAHALAFTCRYGGHTPFFYSVAHHSTYAAARASSAGYEWEVVLSVLMHDAAEAYLGDIPRPIKHTEAFREYRELEYVVQRTIHKALNLPPVNARINAIIHDIDHRMLSTEQLYVMQQVDSPPWFPDHKPFTPDITPRDPEAVRGAFKALFRTCRQYC